MARGGGGRWKGGEVDVIHFNLFYYIPFLSPIVSSVKQHTYRNMDCDIYSHI